MADLTNAQKAVVLVDGEPILFGNAGATSSDDAICEVRGIEGTVYAIGHAAGNAIISVTKGTRSGTLAVTVSEAPLVITLGTPEPK